MKRTKIHLFLILIIIFITLVECNLTYDKSLLDLYGLTEKDGGESTEEEVIEDDPVETMMMTREELQSIIDSANEGDVITIPEGTMVCTESIIIRTGITFKGAGKNKTIIKKTGEGVVLYINIDQEKPFRITGCTFNGNNESIAIDIHGNPKNFRIDNNKFEKCRARAIIIIGYIYGVIDHNEFIDNSVTDIVIYGDNDAGWDREDYYISTYGSNLGHPEFVFIEDNTFNYTGIGKDPEHSVASNHGARYVFRYNTINSVYRSDFHFAAPIDAHGNYSYGRGTVAYEIYNNTIESEHSYRGMYIRGGSGVIFNNTFIGDFTEQIHLTNYRSWCTPSGASSGGCPIGVYEPYYCADDYPCQDQINDLYIWNNTYNGTTIQSKVDNRGYNTIHIQENRDYFHEVGPGYTPYTYPHPLVN